MQAKRIQVNENNVTAGGQVNVSLETPVDPREETNFHNIWGSVSVEPQNGDANAQGTWALLLMREGATTPTLTDVVVNGEVNNAIIVACGVWSASNQSPYNTSFHPATSRTLQAGDKMTLICIVTGITVGSASTRVMLCSHVTRK